VLPGYLPARTSGRRIRLTVTAPDTDGRLRNAHLGVRSVPVRTARDMGTLKGETAYGHTVDDDEQDTPAVAATAVVQSDRRSDILAVPSRSVAGLPEVRGGTRAAPSIVTTPSIAVPQSTNHGAAETAICKLQGSLGNRCQQEVGQWIGRAREQAIERYRQTRRTIVKFTSLARTSSIKMTL